MAQIEQVLPLLPHAVTSVPGRQIPFEQQPLGHVAEHGCRLPRDALTPKLPLSKLLVSTVSNTVAVLPVVLFQTSDSVPPSAQALLL